MMPHDRTWRRAVRRAALCAPHDSCPIETIPGSNQVPVERGESWHYTNISGDRIIFPNSYAKKGWSSLVYHPSTRRVEVGENWRPGKKVDTQANLR